MRVYPLRNTADSLMGFSLDIKSAHKLVVIRESDRGLLGFTLDGVIYFYKVAPFGATFRCIPLDKAGKLHIAMHPLSAVVVARWIFIR